MTDRIEVLRELAKAAATFPNVGTFDRFYEAASPDFMLKLLEVVKDAREAAEALERSYDAVEWPADGTSRQELAAAALRSSLDALERA